MPVEGSIVIQILREINGIGKGVTQERAGETLASIPR